MKKARKRAVCRKTPFASLRDALHGMVSLRELVYRCRRCGMLHTEIREVAPKRRGRRAK